MAAKKGQFTERIQANLALLEREEGRLRRIKIEGAITADVVNGNKRRYPSSVLEAAVAELRIHLNESPGQGRAIQLLGEAEHPSEKGGRPNLLETVVKWDEVIFNGTRVDVIGSLVDTSKGKDIQALMEGGVLPGVSLRGYGEGKSNGKGDDKVFDVTELHITGFDLVLEPSFENAAQLIESQQIPMEEEMSDELVKKLEEQAAEKAALQKQLDEAKALIEEGKKAQMQLEEARVQAAIEAAVAEACKDLPYGETLNGMFTEAMKDQAFTSAEAVAKFAESLHKQYGKIAASMELKKKGFVAAESVSVRGPVIEIETGTPEFASGAFQLTESVRRFEMRSKSAIIERADSPAAVFTKLLLERYDKLYMRQLLQESRLLTEAELTTDLNLPYSVSRAIIEEAFPNLVAANIFDVGVMEQSPMRLYYEATTGETGYAVTVTDEVEAGGAESTWYALSHGRIDPGSVVVTSNPAGTTYTEGTDYVINYADGKIKFLSAGAIDTNDVLVDYTCSEMRGGEMDPIERVKTSLSYKTIEAAADRLADQISSEAIVFSRSQLGWDAVSRTMANLVRTMRRKIDQGLLYMAFSAVKSVASNSTAAWTVSTTQDDLADLYAKLGNAAVIVAKRFYEPTFYLASITNTDRLSNWEGFKREGFPQAMLNAAGFAGMAKNRPIFSSTEFPDTLWIAGNRELVQHRVFQPLTIKGPYPTYDIANSTTKLVAADQYYAEEYNATEALVPEKGAWVPVEAASS